jgi:hypothetical protein
MTLITGNESAAAASFGSRALSSVHGQPNRPLGGAGSSFKLGQFTTGCMSEELRKL